MDPSIRRVLEALAEGPATVGILWTSFHMELEEAKAALAAAMDEGYVEDVGPMSFGLTEDGVRALRSIGGTQGRTASQIKAAGTRTEQDQAGGVHGSYVGAPRHFGRGVLLG